MYVFNYDSAKLYESLMDSFELVDWDSRENTATYQYKNNKIIVSKSEQYEDWVNYWVYVDGELKANNHIWIKRLLNVLEIYDRRYGVERKIKLKFPYNIMSKFW